MSTDTGTFIVELAVAAVVGSASALLTLGKYREKVNKTETELVELKKKVDGLMVKHAEVATKLEERTGSAEAKILKRKSPVSLNEYGEKILKESGGDGIVLNHLDELVEEIKKLGYKTAYDVQENAKRVIENNVSKDWFTPAKDYAYKQGISLELVNLAMGVYLRDLALPKLGFKPEDIDASDPAKKKDE